jgi:hypothetical protein
LPESRQLFRVVKSHPPTLDDFLSQSQVQPRRMPPANATAEELRLHRAVSHQTTLAGARALAHKFPQMGGFVAELAVHSDLPIEIGPERKRHVNVWGEPEVLLACVVKTFRV